MERRYFWTNPLHKKMLSRSPSARLLSFIFDMDIDDSDLRQFVDSVHIETAVINIIESSVRPYRAILTTRDQEIVMRRFGFGFTPMTYRQIGMIYNLTAARVMSIIYRERRIMRHPSRARKLKQYII